MALAAIVAGASADDLETRTLDFKQDARSEKETGKVLAAAAACLANAEGGTLVLGVRDKPGGPGAILGTVCTADWCRQRVHELTTPSLPVETGTLTIGGRSLIRLDVPRGIDVYETDGRFTRRIGKGCERMSAREIVQLSGDRIRSDWSADVSGNAATRTDPEAMRVMRRMLEDAERDDIDSGSTSDADLLRRLRLVGPDGSSLTNAAALLIGGDDGSWPRIQYSWRATAGAEPTIARTVEAPLVRALGDVLDLVSARIETVPADLVDGVQRQIADFPLKAVREALANALLHRDYRLPGAVLVEHSPESLRVGSPGGFPSGVSSANILTHGSVPRNPSLFRVAEKLGLAEERGLGVDRMYRETLRAGHPTPAIVETRSRTLVVFTRGDRDRRFIGFVASLPRGERDSVETLLVCRSLLDRPTLSADALADVIQKTPDEARAVLQRLAALPGRRLIEATRGTRDRRSPTYRFAADALRALGASVPYNRAPLDEIDRKVMAHLREYGRVSNRTLQNMLDVDVYRARDVLRRLGERKIIVRTSKATRGPSVEYGMGSGFDEEEAAGRG